MKELVYSVCCFLIAVWTALTIVGGILMFSKLPDLQSELQSTTGIGGDFLSGVVALWLFTQVTAWGIVVVPLALIAILARPVWPMQIGGEVSSVDRRLQSLADRKAPTIEPASPASSPPA